MFQELTLKLSFFTNIGFKHDQNRYDPYWGGYHYA